MTSSQTKFDRRSYLKPTAARSAMETGVTCRRGFLKMAGMTAMLAKSACDVFAFTARDITMPSEFKLRLQGPILSIPTVYTRELKIDFQGVGNMIDGALKAGVKVFALTNGNNQYDRLTYDEIKELTRFVVEAVGNRGVKIAATGPWWTGQAVDYARFAESAGVDAVQVLMSPYGEDDSQFEHFRAVAAATKLGLVVHGWPSMALWGRLLTIDSIVALKDEEPTPGATVPIYQKFGDRLNIFGGGTKVLFVTYQPYGMRAYYSTFATFAPDVAMRFWNAVQRGQWEEEKSIIFKYDVPFFERFSHPFWRATLEVFGVAKRYVRPPERSFSDEQMAEVRAFYQGLGLSPGPVRALVGRQ